MGLPEKLAHKLSSDHVLAFRHLLRVLIAKGRPVKVKRRIRCCRDSKDNAYLEACFAAKANFLITGDKDLLVMSAKVLHEVGLGSLLVVTPGQFLQVIE